MIKIFCFIALWVGGLTGVIYELSWVNLLKPILGSDELSLSYMLSIFIGSYALGNLLAGFFTLKSFSLRFFLLIYSLIEFLNFVYAVSISEFTQNFSVWTLFWPSLLLGFAFPILSEILSKLASLSGFQITNLYVSNNLGAILGVLLLGFYFLPTYGDINAIRFSAFLNLGVALCAFVLSWFVRQSIVSPATRFSWDFLKDSQEFFLWFLVFVLGFINLGFEILWTKAISPWIASPFALIIFIVLAGITLGAYLLNCFKKQLDQFQFFFFQIFCVFVLSSLVSIWFFIHVDAWISSQGLLLKVFSIVAMSLPVTLIEGFLVAMIFYYCSNQHQHTGFQVGIVSALNTVGAILDLIQWALSSFRIVVL